ncbi:hypothetical protein KC571_01205 [candidate division WWE3 bacterium]|uniref:Uncharacterized protein n=1 Tax=candidate division WWE3 bacterium TaxID=2053526 RepID=A0A955LGH6_UNCKA|nr:hypothetical protein [candidate division WWE3 bacterium]
MNKQNPFAKLGLDGDMLAMLAEQGVQFGQLGELDAMMGAMNFTSEPIHDFGQHELDLNLEGWSGTHNCQVLLTTRHMGNHMLLFARGMTTMALEIHVLDADESTTADEFEAGLDEELEAMLAEAEETMAGLPENDLPGDGLDLDEEPENQPLDPVIVLNFGRFDIFHGYRTIQLMLQFSGIPISEDVITACGMFMLRGETAEALDRYGHAIAYFGGMETVAEILAAAVPETLIEHVLSHIIQDNMKPWMLTQEAVQKTVTWEEEWTFYGCLSPAEYEDLKAHREAVLAPYQEPIDAFVQYMLQFITDDDIPFHLIGTAADGMKKDFIEGLIMALERIPAEKQSPVLVLSLALTISLSKAEKSQMRRNEGNITILNGVLSEATDWSLNWYDAHGGATTSDRACRTFVRQNVYAFPNLEVVDQLRYGPM